MKKDKQDLRIHIVGAGISGLVAAKVLEEHGYSPTIIEATDRAGGRVKTDVVEGYKLDRGFQVLLTAYPAARKHLNLDALDLQRFLPGAAIFNEGKKSVIGDPLRAISLLFPTLFSGIGSLADKYRVLKLNNLLKVKDISKIFAEEEKTTMTYLRDFGFSSQMIDHFFRPFFAGIFLEPHLETSSRMFEFVYKMFGEGDAALPKSGIEAIPQQLVHGLTKTEFQYDTKVYTVEEGQLHLANGNSLKSGATIIATDAKDLIPNYNGKTTMWKSCDTLYFETDTRVIDKRLIGLVSDSGSIVNNIFYHTSLDTETQPQHELLSVTVVKEHDLTEEALIAQIQKELKKYCGIDAPRFLKRYRIPRALPDLRDIQYDVPLSETQFASNIFLAGDTLLNGSLNAAMISGEQAALAVVEKMVEAPVS